MSQIQYITDEQNKITAVIVPIDLWREIQSEKETAYLLKSETMKKRLWRPKSARRVFPLTKPVRNLEFDPNGFEDLAWWVEQDREKALRIIKLIKEVQRNPFTGTGRPEPLKHELAGCWSRRIDQEHRLVYQLTGDKISLRT